MGVYNPMSKAETEKGILAIQITCQKFGININPSSYLQLCLNEARDWVDKQTSEDKMIVPAKDMKGIDKFLSFNQVAKVLKLLRTMTL